MFQKLLLLTIFFLNPGEVNSHSLSLEKDFNYTVLVEPENKLNRIDCALFKQEELISAEENKSEYSASCILAFTIYDTTQYKLVVQNSSELKAKYTVKISKINKIVR